MPIPPSPPTPHDHRAAESELAALRERIDQLNSELLDLLERRAAIVLRIGAAKRQLGLAPFDPAREEQMLEELERRNPGPLAGEDVRAIFSAVFRACLALQHRNPERPSGAAAANRGALTSTSEPSRP